MTAEAAGAGEDLPLNGRIGAIKDFENTIFGFQCALDAGGGEDEEILKLPQMEQAHHRVHISGRQKDAGDGRTPGRIRIRSEFRGGKNLAAQIR